VAWRTHALALNHRNSCLTADPRADAEWKTQRPAIMKRNNWAHNLAF